jgi:dTDP-4-amino-4,6-dideoxygalactose transaminase
MLRRPIVPDDCVHNAHMYYLVLPTLAAREDFIARLKATGVNPVFHYVPLHDSPAGRRFGRVHGGMANTDAAGDRLVRMPLWLGMEDTLDQVLSAADAALDAAGAG